MRRWIASAAMLWCVVTGSAAHAAAPESPFQRVPKIHPAYASVIRLERHHYFTGSPAGAFGGYKERTRYEFAIATERLYRSLKPRVLEATHGGELREDLSTLRELIHEFEPEIVGLGLDVSDVDKQLDALDARLVKLDNADRQAAPSPQVTQAAGAATVLAPRRSFGIESALYRSLVANSFSDPAGTDFTRLPADPAPSQVTGQVGPAQIGFHATPADHLHSNPGAPFQNSTAGMSYGAQLNMAMGNYLLGAFYNRDGSVPNQFRLLNPYLPAGSLESVGGSVSGPISRTLGFQLETAAFSSLENDPSQLVYFKGDVQYALNRRLNVLLGYEWMRKLGAGEINDGAAYLLGLRQSIGANVRFDFLYRSAAPTRAGGGASSTEAGNSSAITQISVRF